MFLLPRNHDNENITKIGQKHFMVYPAQKYINVNLYITLNMWAVVKMCEKRGLQMCPLQTVPISV